jgi:FkbM family methyltransferase
MRFKSFVKKFINNAFGIAGFEISKKREKFSMTGCLNRLKSRGFYPNYILDIGAAYREWSLMCSRVFPDANYLLVEPLEEYKNTLQNKMKKIKNSQFVMTALGPYTGETKIHVQDDFVGSSILLDPDPRFPGIERTIPLITADDLINETNFNIPELVKVDVQTYELEVLKGASKLIGTTEVFILEGSLFRFLEGSPLIHEMIEYMTIRNYLIDDIAGYICRPYDGALGQLDIAFVKSNSPLRKSNLW